MDRVAFFENLMVMAASDGKFTDEEMAYLIVRAEQWGITDAQVQNAINQAASSDAALAIPPGREDRLELLRDLVRLMAADGELHETEKRLCATAAAIMDFSGDQFDQLLDSLL